MIDYATWCAIRDGVEKHLTADQLATALSLDVKTVRRWIGRPYAQRQSARRDSKLDPFKGRIVRWLEAHPLSAQQVFQRLRDEGYGGGISIVKDYVRAIRPRPREAFLSLAFAPGEAAQVDWGEFGTLAVGDTRRRLLLGRALNRNPPADWSCNGAPRNAGSRWRNPGWGLPFLTC